jgi:hypothetical protein
LEPELLQFLAPGHDGIVHPDRSQDLYDDVAGGQHERYIAEQQISIKADEGKTIANQSGQTNRHQPVGDNFSGGHRYICIGGVFVKAGSIEEFVSIHSSMQIQNGLARNEHLNRERLRVALSLAFNLPRCGG